MYLLKFCTQNQVLLKVVKNQIYVFKHTLVPHVHVKTM